MSWQDNLAPASYTSPSGLNTPFLYEDVSRQLDKKTTAYDFVDADGTQIQDFGEGGRRFPFLILISGDTYDTVADAFFDSLGEAGQGILNHPRYGQLPVVPFGKIVQRDDLKTAGNQAVFQVVFWLNTGTTRPNAEDDPVSAIANAVLAFNDVQATAFEDEMNLGRVSVVDRFRATYTRIKGQVSTGLQAIANTQANVKNLFDTVNASIDANLDVLVRQPLTLARQTQIMIGAPARALTSIRARLDGFKNLAKSIVQSATGSNADPNAPTITGLNPIPGNSPALPPVAGIPKVAVIPADPALATDDALSASNKFQTEDLYVSSLLIGMVISVINTEQIDDPIAEDPATLAEAAALTTSVRTGTSGFVTRSDAISAADELLAQFAAVSAWRDGNFQTLEQIDQGTVYQKLQEAVALAAGYLVELSFSLKQERRITLDRERTPLDLAAELYGETDSKLDFIITSNDLNGDEMFAIPRGREIVYYI